MSAPAAGRTGKFRSLLITTLTVAAVAVLYVFVLSRGVYL